MREREREKGETNHICGGVWRGISCAERRTSSSSDPETIEETTPWLSSLSRSFVRVSRTIAEEEGQVLLLILHRTPFFASTSERRVVCYSTSKKNYNKKIAKLLIINIFHFFQKLMLKYLFIYFYFFLVTFIISTLTIKSFI